MRVRYTITMEREVSLEDWGAINNGGLLKKIKESLQEDPHFITDTVFEVVGDTINVEIVENAPL